MDYNTKRNNKMTDTITSCYYCGNEKTWWTGSKFLCENPQCMEQALREDSASFIYPEDDMPYNNADSTAWWSSWWAV